MDLTSFNSIFTLEILTYIYIHQLLKKKKTIFIDFHKKLVEKREIRSTYINYTNYCS